MRLRASCKLGRDGRSSAHYWTFSWPRPYVWGAQDPSLAKAIVLWVPSECRQSSSPADKLYIVPCPLYLCRRIQEKNSWKPLLIDTQTQLLKVQEERSFAWNRQLGYSLQVITYSYFLVWGILISLGTVVYRLNLDPCFSLKLILKFYSFEIKNKWCKILWAENSNKGKPQIESAEFTVSENKYPDPVS